MPGTDGSPDEPQMADSQRGRQTRRVKRPLSEFKGRLPAREPGAVSDRADVEAPLKAAGQRIRGGQRKLGTLLLSKKVVCQPGPCKVIAYTSKAYTS